MDKHEIFGGIAEYRALPSSEKVSCQAKRNFNNEQKL